jgi:hypothetical protein
MTPTVSIAGLCLEDGRQYQRVNRRIEDNVVNTQLAVNRLPSLRLSCVMGSSGEGEWQ